MFNYPVEKDIIRFYKYKFYGFDKLVVVEAYNKIQARLLLNEFIENNIAYQGAKVIAETLSLPIIGVTKKKVDEIEYVWCGTELSQSGWMTAWDFERLGID